MSQVETAFSTTELEAMYQFEQAQADTLQVATTRYGLGVIAVDDGSKQGTYVEAGDIANYTPAAPIYDVPTAVEMYRRYSHGSPAAIDIRCKWAARTALLEKVSPHIVLGRE